MRPLGPRPRYPSDPLHHPRFPGLGQNTAANVGRKRICGIEVVVCAVQWLSHETVPEWRGAGEPNSETGGYWGPDVAGPGGPTAGGSRRWHQAFRPRALSVGRSWGMPPPPPVAHPVGPPSPGPPPLLPAPGTLLPRLLEGSPGDGTAGGGTDRLAPRKHRLSIPLCSHAGPKPPVTPVSEAKGHRSLTSGRACPNGQ